MIDPKDLKKQKLLSDLNDTELERIGRTVERETYAKGAPVFTEGAFFGELSVIEDRKIHSTNATAIDAVELYRIRTEDFKSLEASDPQMMYKVMKTVARMASRNIHMMNEKLMKALISY